MLERVIACLCVKGSVKGQCKRLCWGLSVGVCVGGSECVHVVD